MRLFIFLLISVNSICFSQKKTIKVEYAFNLNIGNYQEYKSYLYINNKKSLFLWNKPTIEKSEDENDISVNLNELDSIGSFNFKDFSKDSIYSRIPYFKKEILLLKEKTPSIKWEITDEMKKIGSYTCQKATTKFRGRDYIAWFTNEIPIQSGPWKLQGLPGLILIAYDTNRVVQFIFSSISETDYKINPILKANRIIDLNEYKKLQKSSSQGLVRTLRSKLPRGADIQITSTKGIESFN